MQYLVPIIVLSSISLFLGILLLLADKFLADYGECKIRINGEKELHGPGRRIHPFLPDRQQDFHPFRLRGQGYLRIVQGTGGDRCGADSPHRKALHEP